MRWVPPAHSPLRWSDLRRALTSHASSHTRAREALQRAFNADVALLCDSGTSALSVALQIGARSHPGAVAIPAYACFDIATAVNEHTDVVIPYDIDPRTLGPDFESLKRALHAGAQRVIVAPLYGVPLEWQPLRALCDAAGALLIEDAAQGSGASWEGTPHGALGELAVLSFGRGKGRTAGGGGALVARGAAWVEKLNDRSGTLLPSTASAFNITLRLGAQLAFSSPTRFGWIAAVPGLQIGETKLQPSHPAHRMANAQATLVPTALEREDTEVAERRRTAAQWRYEMPSKLKMPHIHERGLAGYLRFPVFLDRASNLNRHQRMLGLGAPYPRVLSELPMIASRSASSASEPLLGARELVERLVTLPTHSLLMQRDRDAIMKWLEAQR
jgi:perosamine synthetase